ncbi:MAG: LysE family transporter [Anaerolineales bacterium]|jgi:threonine/homoserine/homoserine lactone efflux protein
MPSSGFAAIFIFSFLISLGAVVSPGPVSAAIVSESPRQGWRVGPLIAAGHTMLELGMVLLIAVGLVSGMAHPNVQRVIAGGGGLLLAFIGLSYILGVLQKKISLPRPEEKAQPRGRLALFSLGAATTASNPFWYAWWVTVAAGYLSQAQEMGLLAVAGFYLGHISADFAWDSGLAYATHAGSRWLNNDRYRALILLTGIFMVYLAGVFLRTAIQPT